MKYFKNKKARIFAGVAGLVFFAVLGVAIYFGIPALVKIPTVNFAGEANRQTGLIPRKIDGVLVLAGQENLAINAVLIENHPDARPLSGLSNAALVYEAPVEGGITRFLAIFSGDANADEIGPVRSARPYFIDFAREFGGIFAHVGGSDAALEDLRTDKQNIADLNQYFKSEYYWRDETRFAPHNVYTSDKLLAAADKDLNVSAPEYGAWKFKLDAPLNLRPEKNEAALDYSTASYSVKWVYDKIHNSYIRYEGGKIQKDKNGPAVRAKNVVILKTEIEIIDAITRRRIKTVGEGGAAVFMDGAEIAARWKKESAASRLKFYALNGDEIAFNAGPTWIEIVSE